MLGAPETAIKERLGHAVVDLIVARAGCYTTQPPTDYKSLDINIAPMADDLPHQIDVQIKSTTTLVPHGSSFKYKLERRNYDHLRRTDLTIPRMLLVADLHQDSTEWISCSTDMIAFCKAVYWMDLFDFPDAKQKSKVPLLIPTSNRLTAEELVCLLQRGYDNAKAGKGGVS